MPPHLTKELVASIHRAAPDQNCGAYIQRILQIQRHVGKADARLREDIRRKMHRSVVASLTRFGNRVNDSSIIQMCSMKPRTKPLLTRVSEAYTKVKSSPNMKLDTLIEICRSITLWKEEALVIVRELGRVSRYLKEYLQNTNNQAWSHDPSYMGDLVVHHDQVKALRGAMRNQAEMTEFKKHVQNFLDRYLLMDRSVHLPIILMSVDDDVRHMHAVKRMMEQNIDTIIPPYESQYRHGKKRRSAKATWSLV